MVGNDEEKDRLQNLVKSCLLEINKLKMDLMNLEKEKSLLKSDDKVGKLEAVIKEKETEIANLKNDLKNLEVSLNNKDDVIKNQELKIKDLSNFKDSFDDIKAALEKDLNNFKTQELKEHNDKLKSSLATIVEKDKEIKSLISEIESYKEKIKDLKNNIDSKDNLLELQREIDAKDNEIKVLKAAAVDESALKSLKKEIEGKERRIKELEKIQASFDEVKASYEDRLVGKDKRIKELEQIQSSFEDIKTSLEKDIKEHKGKELEKINSKLQSALDKLVEKDNKIKSLVEELDDKKLEIKKLESSNIPKNDYDRLKEEIELKDIKIKKLEEIKGLFSDLDKGSSGKSKKSKSLDLSENSSASGNVDKIIAGSDDTKNKDKSSGREVEKLKKELKSCMEANKELEKIKDNYKRLTSSPKRDLTSFQSQIYYLIPDKPMSSQEIHGYIREIAFKDISYKNINNIIRGLERRGYLKPEDPENSADGKWVRTDKK